MKPWWSLVMPQLGVVTSQQTTPDHTQLCSWVQQTDQPFVNSAAMLFLQVRFGWRDSLMLASPLSPSETLYTTKSLTSLVCLVPWGHTKHPRWKNWAWPPHFHQAVHSRCAVPEIILMKGRKGMTQESCHKTPPPCHRGRVACEGNSPALAGTSQRTRISSQHSPVVCEGKRLNLQAQLVGKRMFKTTKFHTSYVGN